MFSDHYADCAITQLKPKHIGKKLARAGDKTVIEGAKFETMFLRRMIYIALRVMMKLAIYNGKVE